MFKIQPEANKSINWPVVVEVAVDGGKIQKYDFTGTFIKLSDDERDALTASTPVLALADSDAEALAGAWKEAMLDQIMRVMTGWKGVVDADDKPLDFTRENLRQAARGASGVSVLRAINTAMGEISSGARTKN